MRRRLMALSGEQCRLLASAWAMGILCCLALRLFRYQRVRALLKRAAARVPAAEFPDQQLVWAVQAGLDRVPGTACLARSLVLEALLRAAGRNPEVCLGVALERGFRAHAWVELDGAPILGAPQPGEYIRLLPVGVKDA